ncbi:O-antigen ligase [Sinomonas atrocyanea]|uniref:hypothetical protein n=1 Tax=Sinomonas atrocyanea TaxID=37927 RepID=UPI002780C302|nr:hypothetical protein [Sinomonas atrocyanea]MDP9885839.1 O-antigen ligase [Sinomonas atrocyanea]
MVPDVVGLPLFLAIFFGVGRWRRKGSLRGAKWLFLSGVVSGLAYVFFTYADGESPFQRAGVILAANVVGLIAYLIVAEGSLDAVAFIIAGHALAWVLHSAMAPVGDAAGSFGNLWKYAIAVPVTILVLFVANSSERRSLVSGVLLFVIGIVSIFLNFRSHGLVCAVAGAILIAVHNQGFGQSGRRSRVRSSIALVLVLLPVLALPALIESGIFGATVQEKALSQSDGGPVLLAGRTEPAMSYFIISARPLTGWGSVANVPESLVLEGRDFLQSVGVDNTEAIYRLWHRSGYEVTLHSMLAQLWVEGGLLAGIFLVVLIGAGMVAAFRWKGPFGGMVVYLALQIAWDTLFSPHTAYTATLWGMAAALFAIGSRRNRGSLSEARFG